MVIKVNQDCVSHAILLVLVCHAGHAINKPYAGYTRYAKHACYQSTGFKEVL